ncbi:MAG TPA: hypothetical protein VFI84_01505 [Candidatus Saccharimonadales bacterium]|nr:hypothetical protein [Candidatus Saccharimonadales bacterium]
MARTKTKKHGIKLAALVMLPSAVVISLLILLPAYGNGNLTERAVTIDNPIVGQTATYQISFTIQDPDAVGSLSLQFCSNSPLEVEACIAPNGFDLSSATLEQDNGLIDMTIFSRTANTMVLSRPPAPIAPPLTVIFKLHTVVNPSDTGTYYARIATYGSIDASGSRISFGGLAFAMAQSVNVNTVVPPYLIECAAVTIPSDDCASASGNYINFGNLASSTTKSGQSQVFLATNAQNGYSLYVNGRTMTSGNNTIPALQNPDVSRPGTNQFGINLRANSDPAVGADPTGTSAGSVTGSYNTPNLFTFNTGDMIATASTVEGSRWYTISYLLNIAQGQAPGVYSTTMVYTALANF